MVQNPDSPHPVPDFSETEQRWLAAEVHGAGDPEAALAAVVRREAVIDYIAENGSWGNVGTEVQMEYWSAVDEAGRLNSPGS